ncbi:hypothetical protein O3M35_011087 [Rhynocoris fuscipes]|uniref:Uncharacterized protein n=1 Tax=Rhynocoris fuscipes TaxID=488301 RepID=A0AAW1CX83_9HEMI
MNKTWNSSTSEKSNKSNIANIKQNALNRSMRPERTNTAPKDTRIPSTVMKPKNSVKTYTSTPLVKDKIFNCQKYPAVINNSYTIKYPNSVSKIKPGRSIHDSACKLFENKCTNSVLSKIPKSVQKTNYYSNKKNNELNNLRRRLSMRYSAYYVKNKSASRLLEFDKNPLEIKTNECNDQIITNNFEEETINNQKQLNIKCNTTEKEILSTPEATNSVTDELKENVLEIKEKAFNVAENEIEIQCMKTDEMVFNKDYEKDMLRFKKLIEIQKEIVENECKKLSILAQIFQIDECKQQLAEIRQIFMY